MDMNGSDSKAGIVGLKGVSEGRRSLVLITAILTAALLLESCFSDPGHGPRPMDLDGSLSVDYEGVSARISGDKVKVFLPIAVGWQPRELKASATLFDLSRNIVGRAESTVKAVQGKALAELELEARPDMLETSQTANYVIEYTVTADRISITDRKSLFEAVPKTAVKVLGPADMQAGSTAAYRIIVRDPETSRPVQGAAVKVFLSGTNENSDGGDVQDVLLFEGETGSLGDVTAEFEVPEDILGRASEVASDLKIVVDTGKAVEYASALVAVKRPQKVLLTTDKPMYQPGQVIHMRTLSLKRPELVPEAGARVLFEVLDAKGNKVFKKETRNNEYGVAFADFKLATLVNTGEYTIKAMVGDTVSEKTVTVDRYVLPKFKIELATDRDFYKPGQWVSGSIRVKYFFGKPVSGASVSIAASKMDVELNEFARVDGRTDQDGGFDFKIKLPDYFVGQPLDQGDAFVLLSAQVTDSAGHEQRIEKTRPVVGSSILIQVVPESGDVVPGVENVFYLVATDPLARPVQADCEVTVAGVTMKTATNQRGIAVFNALPPDQGRMYVSVKAVAGTGEEATASFDFKPGAGGAFVLLRTDRSLYKVGDTANIRVICPNISSAAQGFKDRIYLDVLKEGRSILVTTVKVEDGVARYDLDIDSSLAGGFQVQAYYLGEDGNVYRDAKVVYVHPAGTLKVSMRADKGVFLPGEEATLTFEVKDSAGRGVQSAIGFQVVDEAVFALVDFKPGLEKVFYDLEQDIMNPKYEIHGFDWDDVVQGDDSDTGREQEAGVLLAAAGDSGFGVSIDTYANLPEEAVSATLKVLDTDVAAIREGMSKLVGIGAISGVEEAENYILSNHGEWADPWGGLYRFRKMDYWRDPCVIMSSSGMDKAFGTSDDIHGAYCFSPDFTRLYVIGKAAGDKEEDIESGRWPDRNFGGDTDVDFDEDADPGWDQDQDAGGKGECSGNDCGGVRVRRYFPETLHVEPCLITDQDGTAQVEIPLADSITTWRISALASSLDGRLGSAQEGVTVFQDFFADIDFPRTLTRNDEISVPVALYNYLDEPQDVTLSVELGDWFELLDAADKVVHLDAGEVKAEHFRIKALDVGWQEFVVYAYGDQASDAVARSVEVEPDGKEVSQSFGGRLHGAVEHALKYPLEAVPGANVLFVKIYPGLFSQVIEGLDSILRMPSGCFEQTSSATYPNVMVLDYMMTTGKITPEIELKARDYIAQGYQRLLTFEVPGGGFEWFGNPPAHNILTAYGLLEFTDMAQVHPVDEAVLDRTRTWLLSQQEPDGSFKPSSGGIAEGAINAYKDDLARTTAYITYALLESGYDGTGITRAVGWLKSHLEDVGDDYTKALFANTFLAYSTRDPVGKRLLDELHEGAIAEGGKLHWKGKGESLTYGEAGVMDIETTALVVYAMIRAGAYPDDVAGGLDYLASKKDSFGNWSTTQATVLALKAMIAAEKFKGGVADATVTVRMDGVVAGRLDIDKETGDVMRTVDLSDYAGPGEHVLNLDFEGEGRLMYQVVSRYYMPWKEADERPSEGTLSIDVEYDKTTLEVDDVVNVEVTVTNNVEGNVARMVLVDIGLPPGFELLSGDLDAAVKDGVLQKYETTPRQLILYVEKIAYGEPLVVYYRLRAKYPVEASTGESDAHPYYDPDDKGQDGPQVLVVN